MLAYIKYGYLEFIKYLKLNLIIAIELTALIIMSIFTVSTLNSQLRFYKPSVIMPIIIIGKTQPREIIKSNE